VNCQERPQENVTATSNKTENANRRADEAPMIVHEMWTSQQEWTEVVYIQVKATWRRPFLRSVEGDKWAEEAPSVVKRDQNEQEKLPMETSN